MKNSLLLSRGQWVINQAHFHAEIPTKILSASDLSSNDKLVYEIIYTMVMEGNNFNESNKYIAKQLHIGVATIQRSIRHLVNKNYLQINYISHKSKNNNVYFKKRYISKMNWNKLGKIDMPLKFNKLNNHLKHQNNNTHLSNIPMPVAHHLTASDNTIINYIAPKIALLATNYSTNKVKNIISKEYKAHRVKISNLLDAFPVYKYDICIKHERSSIKSDIGFICSLTMDDDITERGKKDRKIVKRYDVKKVKEENKQKQNSNNVDDAIKRYGFRMR